MINTFCLDDQLQARRRLYPKFQIVRNSLSVVRNGDQSLTVSYRPNNCSINLNPASVVQNSANYVFTSLTHASPPVTGSYEISWRDSILNSKNNFSNTKTSILKKQTKKKNQFNFKTK